MTAAAERLAKYYSGYHEGGRERMRTDLMRSDGVHPMSKGWQRYRPNQPIIVEGENWYTEIQYRLRRFADTHEGERFTVREMAESLGCAPSTVTRALTKLAALKLIAFDVVKGRYGGVTFLSTAWADLKARSRQAWARIADERRKVWDRYVRRLDRSLYWWAGVNVASYTDMDATLNGASS